MSKYKLINVVTKTETICDKVTIKGCDYYINDDKIEDWFFQKNTNSIIKHNTKNGILLQPQIFDKKVIATNNSKLSIPQVVNETLDYRFDREFFNPLIVQIVEEIRHINYKLFLSIGNKLYSVLFEHYKSKITNSFTEDDMIEFGKWIALNCYRFTPNYKGIDKTTWWDLDNPKKSNLISTEELLNIWKEQRPKIIYYA